MHGNFHCNFFAVVAKHWTHPLCLPVGYLLNELWYVYTMQYFTAIKKKKVFSTCRVGRFSNIHCHLKRAELKQWIVNYFLCKRKGNKIYV